MLGRILRSRAGADAVKRLFEVHDDGLQGIHGVAQASPVLSGQSSKPVHGAVERDFVPNGRFTRCGTRALHLEETLDLPT